MRDIFAIAHQLIVLSMIFSENRCALFRIMLEKQTGRGAIRGRLQSFVSAADAAGQFFRTW
jgi:hypothetical protein